MKRVRSYEPLSRSIDGRAFTHRRTPKDVDGRRYDVPCVVFGLYLYAAQRRNDLGGLARKRVSRKWYKVRFADGRVDLRHATNLYANKRVLHADGSWAPGVPFVGSHEGSSGLWWQSAAGALERVASVYEKARSEAGDPSPCEGWVLVDAAERVAHYKTLPSIFGPGESETDKTERERRAANLRVRREASAEHARAMYAMHERALRRETKLVAKWKKIKARAEARLASGGDDDGHDDGDEKS